MLSFSVWGGWQNSEGPGLTVLGCGGPWLNLAHHRATRKPGSYLLTAGSIGTTVCFRPGPLGDSAQKTAQRDSRHSHIREGTACAFHSFWVTFPLPKPP